MSITKFLFLCLRLKKSKSYNFYFFEYFLVIIYWTVCPFISSIFDAKFHIPFNSQLPPLSMMVMEAQKSSFVVIIIIYLLCSAQRKSGRGEYLAEQKSIKHIVSPPSVSTVLPSQASSYLLPQFSLGYKGDDDYVHHQRRRVFKKYSYSKSNYKGPVPSVLSPGHWRRGNGTFQLGSVCWLATTTAAVLAKRFKVQIRFFWFVSSPIFSLSFRPLVFFI